MTRWLGVALVILFCGAVAKASTSLLFFANDGPLVATFETNTAGPISGTAWFQGKAGVLQITGPASCVSKASTKRYPSVGCYIGDAPAGVYQMTVSSHSDALTAIYVSVVGELVVTP